MRFPGTPVLAAVALAAAAGVGVPLALASSSKSSHSLPDRRTAAVTTFPGLVRPAGQPLLAALSAAHPRAGVIQAAGPFDDRFALTGLRLDHGVLTGTLTVTSDVSELIDLQVVVGFYSRAGALLGSAAYERHGEGSRPNEVVHLLVTAPPTVSDQAVGAAVGVPVLVNE